MLKVMRDSFQHLRWILVFIVFLFVLYVFVGWGTGGAQGSADDQNVAARVNGETVTVPEYRRALYFTEERYKQAYGQALTPEMVAAMGLPRQVLDSLVDQRLLLQEARRLNLTATPEEIRKKILEIPMLNPDGKFVGPQLYERYVRIMGYNSAADFEADLADELTISKLENAIQQTIVIPAALLEQEYRRREESAKIRYIISPAERFAQQVTVTPAEVEQYYRSNPTRYSHPEQKKIGYLFADTAKLQSQINVSDAEVQAQYEKNKQTYEIGESVRAQHILVRVANDAPSEDVEAAKNKARDLVAKIRAGADFGEIAKANSDDPSSAPNGGDMGFFTKGQMVPEFENAAFSQTVGQVGDPVKSQFGFHIIKILEKRPAGFRPFADVREELRESMITERARAQARDRIAQIRARLEQVRPINEDALRRSADAVVTYNTSPFFTKNDQIEGLGRVPAIATWAFSARDGELGQVVDTPRGPVVPFLKESRAAGVTPLAEIRAQVENDVKMQKGREAAAAALQAAVTGATSIDQIASQLGLKTTDSDVTRDGFISGLSGNVLKLIEAAMVARPGDIKGPIVVDAGAVAFQLIEQKKFDPAAFEKAKEGLALSLRRNEALKLRSSLIERLKKSAKITVNDALINQQQAATPIT